MPKKMMKPKRSSCPIASTLDVVGDKWTLLLIRDIGLFKKHRNKNFQDADERIPSNILAKRLQTMVREGLVEKRLYQTRPPRYEYHLTPSGRALLPVVRALARWGLAHMDGVEVPATLRR
jgi:DNA-binding HxlR family transcriptional regulator